MFWSQLKTAIRILRKQRLTASINILGLGIGLSFFALLIAFVRDDLTFDRFHEKADLIYILTNEFRDRFIGGAHHFIPEMMEAEFPEVAPGSTVRYAMHSQLVRSADTPVSKDFAFTDPGFFNMFSFELLEGDPSRALSNPHQIVITAATAQALLQGVDPLGKILSIRIGDSYQDFSVSGIMVDPSGNSSMRFDGLLPYSQVFDAYQIDKNNNDFVTLPMFTTIFLYLPDAEKAESLRSKLPAFNNRLYGPMWERVKMEAPKTGFGLLGLTDYHLGDVSVSNFVSRGNPAFSWVLTGIALLILILACVNSVNLSLAQSFARFKEVGVRKVIGARRDQLVGQLLAESLLAGLGSLIVGLLGASLLVSPFNSLTGKELSAGALLHPHTLLIVLLSVLAVSFFIGLVPALTLSHFPASEVFRGRFFNKGKGRLSLSLIVFQYTVSLVFIIGTLVISRQLHFMTSTDLGYDPSDIILVHTQVPGEKAPMGAAILDIFRSELGTDSRVLAVSADSGTVGSGHGSVTRRYDKDGRERTAEAFMIDRDFMKTLGIAVISGRDFSMNRRVDIQEGVLVNEAFVREFELEDPIDLRFSDFAVDKLPAEYTFDPTIIGVIRDFHVTSLHEPITPMVFGPRGFPPIQRFRNILVKIKEGEAPAVIERLKNLWSRIRPELPFSYSFLEEALAWEYRRERDWGKIVGWSAGFALFIACIGLFGLSAVAVVRRTKETGIRKVLGASAAQILVMFSKDILRWILISNLIAWPVAFISARKWQEGFAYRVDIGLWIFALASMLSMLIAGLTIGWHASRAALSQPAESLRYE